MAQRLRAQGHVEGAVWAWWPPAILWGEGILFLAGWLLTEGRSRGIPWGR